MTTVVREQTLAERFDPAPADARRLETAIARRNIAWSRWQGARRRLDELASTDLRPFLTAALNDALYDYERASDDLVRERVWYKRAGVPW